MKLPGDMEKVLAKQQKIGLGVKDYETSLKK